GDLDRIERDAQQLPLHLIELHPDDLMMEAVHESHVTGRFELDRGYLMPAHKIPDEREKVLANIRMGRCERVHERVTERRVHRRIGVPLAEPGVVQADGPGGVGQAVFRACTDDPLDRALAIPDERVYTRPDAAIPILVGPEEDRPIFLEVDAP